MGKTKSKKALKLFVTEYGKYLGNPGDCEVFTVLDPNHPQPPIPPSFYLCRGQWRKGYIDCADFTKKGASKTKTR